MSLDQHLEPGWVDDGPEWDDARTAVIADLVEDGYTEAEAEEMADDWTVQDRVESDRASAEAEAADLAIKRRKESM